MTDSAPALLSPLDLGATSVALTKQLCDMPSVSGDEASIADAIVDSLRGFGHLELHRDGDTVVARTNLGRPSRVVIAGHIDTVPINDNVPTRYETLDAGSIAGAPGDYLWGRGTVDMKGGVAVQLKLAAELTAPAVDITWMWYDNEEVSSDLNGLGRLARNSPEMFAGDFAILGEPTNSLIEGGCNGTLRAQIRTHGLRAHSARSWVGDNAIHSLAPVLATLATYEPRQVEVEGLVFREGLNAVGISGGVAGNVIPDAAAVEVNYRFAPSRSGSEAEAHIRELFDGFDVTIVDVAEGARPGLDAPVARQFIDAVGGVPLPKYGWTDVARFSALGVPAVNYGPGDPLKAHADDERVLLSQITACEDGLRRWLNGTAASAE
ncbi:succinyl-diaminopimelate desuccinylase [Agreia sp. VKM Ac-1783]|uniref:succinyl-diaminopimelate desuccinylase n=1 Tax=Agreia sp. VKM Ac-1783 TaxID=1938889 RepID=UPI000A2ACCC1|nr:succinyl-diaminopimelate desuccinylase [Agreia sp. VKM Ac-1783]SMQ68250.1 succinyldiaminopimelate desuccinylase [Agreia sp. VKM Ac-1783]